MDYILSALLLALAIGSLYLLIQEQIQPEKRFQEAREAILEPIVQKKDYSVSGYYDRMENAELDILREQEPVDRTIVLWWGFDGLRLKDGKIEWISRKPPEPHKTGALRREGGYIIDMGEDIDNCPKQTLELQHVFRFDEMQATQAQINALQMQNAALQMQAAQKLQNATIVSSIQGYSGLRPAYIYGGYTFQGIQQSCCNRMTWQ